MIRYFILFECNGFTTRGVTSLNFNKKTGEINLKIDILNSQNIYLKFDNKHQAIKICKNLIFKESY